MHKKFVMVEISCKICPKGHELGKPEQREKKFAIIEGKICTRHEGRDGRPSPSSEVWRSKRPTSAFICGVEVVKR